MTTQQAVEGGPSSAKMAAGNNEGMAISVDHSSATTMSDDGGSSPPGTERSSRFVSKLTGCILQKRHLEEAGMKLGEDADCCMMSPEPGPELEDAESPNVVQWMPGSDHGVAVQQQHPRQKMAPTVVNAPPTPAPNFFKWASSSSKAPTAEVLPHELNPTNAFQRNTCRQFWRAGDYEATPGISARRSGGIDHVRVHPKFLHSNATSHQWVLGAVAELLDNAMDEVKNGATYVKVDVVRSPRDGSPMLMFEDNGGGMTPERMRECMSLGFSTKTKSGNTIGQYGNGFKTSTMRLGADVIVFSRAPATAERRATQTIGLLSFTFLRDTGMQDIIVPMVDYELKNGLICPLLRTNSDDWNRNMKTITDWCPFATEKILFTQFGSMKMNGTKIIIYNLWEDAHGQVELDFESDHQDIRARVYTEEGDVNNRKVATAQRYTYSKYYLTYQYSLRSYAAILYYRHPPGFKIILRGVHVPHHDIAEDLMITQCQSYKPQGFESSRDCKMVANVVMGFVKDAGEHIDVQGFNVYHKNRLIKPFWKVWNTAGSDGRGIVGVLEANFVEPAHDKQSFERTAVLTRLELRLNQMQKYYWQHNCHLVGYVNKKLNRETKSSKRAASKMSEMNLVGLPGPVEMNFLYRQEPLQPRLSVPGFPIQIPSPVNDMSYQLLVRRNNMSGSKPAGPPGFDSGFQVPVDHSGPSTPDVSTPYKNFLWQGLDQSETRESPGDCKSRENVVNGFDALQMMRKGAADPAALQGLLASVTGEAPLYDLEISNELEENKRLLARLHKLEQVEKRSLQFEKERNRDLEAKVLDMEQQGAVDRRFLEQFNRECDHLRETLAEERRLHEQDDEDMRKDFKVKTLHIRQLEAENHHLRLLQ